MNTSPIWLEMGCFIHHPQLEVTIKGLPQYGWLSGDALWSQQLSPLEPGSLFRSGLQLLDSGAASQGSKKTGPSWPHQKASLISKKTKTCFTDIFTQIFHTPSPFWNFGDQRAVPLYQSLSDAKKCQKSRSCWIHECTRSLGLEIVT